MFRRASAKPLPLRNSGRNRTESGGGCKNLSRMLDKTFRLCRIRILFAAGVAQLVERNLAKVEVASSRLVSRSTKLLQITNIGFWPMRPK